MIRRAAGVAFAAILAFAAAAQASDARLFGAHVLDLRSAGITGEPRAVEVLTAMPGSRMADEALLASVWSRFFENAIVKFGRLRSTSPAALYYDPLLDVALLTLWVQRDGEYRVASARALPGERLAVPGAAVTLKPSWMSAEAGLVGALAPNNDGAPRGVPGRRIRRPRAMRRATPSLLPQRPQTCARCCRVWHGRQRSVRDGPMRCCRGCALR